MTLLEPAPVIAVAGAPTPGGPGSWKWQLRDKNGRWIQMGSEVSFSHNGKTITGIIVGSPKEGYATVKLADGSTATVATAGVTSTGKSAGNPTPGIPKASGGGAADGGNTPAVETPKQVKAVAPGLRTQVEPGGKKQPLSPRQRRRARERARARRRRERERGRRREASSSRGRRSSDDEIAAPDDKRLTGTHRTSKSIEALIRIRAKEKGGKDPFADEKKRSSKPKDGGPKDRKKPGDETGTPEKEKGTKKRKDTRKKLTQGQIDAVAAIFKRVLKHVKAGEYSTALSQLDGAKALLKDTSAPWTLKRIHFLQKGLKGIGSLTASGARQVRTPGGARHYGQPIGSVIVANPVSSVSNLSMKTRLEMAETRIAPRADAITSSDYMALRTLRADAIKAFGGSTSRTHAEEYGLARNNALQALDVAATKQTQIKVAVKQLTKARRQVAATRVWADSETRRAQLTTLEAQITQIIARLDPSAAPKRKTVWAGKRDMPKVSRPVLITAAGESWRWQLRDSKGQWIEMGAKVKWMANGLARSGTVIGSPDAGSAIVEDEDGNKVRLTTNRLSLVSAPPVAVGQPQMVNRRERRAVRRQERKAQKATIKADKQTPAMAEAMADMADNIRDNVAPENQAAATEATVDVIVGEVASNLPKRLQLLERVKALKEKGLEAQVRLAVYFQVREAHHKHLLKAKFWAEEFLGDMGATDNPTPSWAAIPTMIGLPNPASNPVEFLTESSKMISQLLRAASSLVSSAVTAAGNSWRWQLRDKDGQWVDMGSRVSWLAKGLLRTGILIGSPKEGTARVRDDKTGQEFTMPSATRLTALPEIGNKVRYTTGGKNPKAVLAEVVGLPKAGRVTVKDLRTGKEKTVAETTVKVLPLDSTREAVREYGGYSVKIDGTLPKTGYMAAQLKGSVKFTPEEFFGPGGDDILMNFMRDNAEQFKADPDVYLGIWYNENGQPPKVVIDVSHNIQDRDTAVLAGRYQDQESIWDVVNEEEIDTGGTGGWEEVVRPSDEGHRPDDGRGVATLVPAGDSGGEAAVDDRQWIRRPPPVGGLRVADARSSMAAFGPQEWAFINNDGGTLADPKHIKTGAGNMSASMSDVIAHYDEVIRDGLQGIPQHPNVDLVKLADAPNWYQRANETSQALLEKYQDQIPGLTLMHVTGVLAAISPRMGWTDNVTNGEKILKKWADPEFRALPISESRSLTAAGMHDNVEIALKILRGDGPEVMTGLKRKSFWNCMLDPTNTWDVCMDGWMASATRRAGLKNLDGGDLDESALAWLDHGMANLQTETVDGAGYVVLGDALRIAAARNGLTPLQAQAVYWIAVGGDAEGAVMWTDEKRKSGTSPLALRKARQREARLAEQLQAHPGESTSGASVPVSVPVEVPA